MIKVGRVVGEVRRIIADDARSDAPRYSDDDITGAMYMALIDMRRMRPDLYLGTALDVEDPADNPELAMSIMYLTPLVYMTAAQVLVENTEHAADGSASGFMAIARSQLIGVA